jgi:hypothetical protein
VTLGDRRKDEVEVLLDGTLQSLMGEGSAEDEREDDVVEGWSPVAGGGSSKAKADVEGCIMCSVDIGVGKDTS